MNILRMTASHTILYAGLPKPRDLGSNKILPVHLILAAPAPPEGGGLLFGLGTLQLSINGDVLDTSSWLENNKNKPLLLLAYFVLISRRWNSNINCSLSKHWYSSIYIIFWWILHIVISLVQHRYSWHKNLRCTIYSTVL